jgi:DNA-binding transcriptional regulator YdaS (Cro superfamily)
MKTNGKIHRGRRRLRKLSPGLQLAVDAVGGTTAALAVKIKLSSQAVSAWTKVPLDRVKQVERATGVPREKLRPDWFR